jgi:hypothetical protein
MHTNHIAAAVDAFTIDEFINNPCSCTSVSVAPNNHVQEMIPALTVCVIFVAYCMYLLNRKHKLA